MKKYSTKSLKALIALSAGAILSTTFVPTYTTYAATNINESEKFQNNDDTK